MPDTKANPIHFPLQIWINPQPTVKQFAGQFVLHHGFKWKSSSSNSLGFTNRLLPSLFPIHIHNRNRSRMDYGCLKSSLLFSYRTSLRPPKPMPGMWIVSLSLHHHNLLTPSFAFRQRVAEWESCNVSWEVKGLLLCAKVKTRPPVPE